MIRHIIITVIISLVALKVRSTTLPITDDDRKAYVKLHNDVRLNVSNFQFIIMCVVQSKYNK